MGTNEKSEIRIVLLGKTGCGKSATGNSIVGPDQFKTSLFPTSETPVCDCKHKLIQGRRVVVIDTPGFFDTGKSESQINDEVKRAIRLAAPGPHVFLFLFPVGTRFTDEENKSFEKAGRLFGKVLDDHCIIVFTHSDKLKQRKLSESDYLSKAQEQLGKLLTKTKNKVLFINNESEDSKTETVNRLLDMIVDISLGGTSYYTSRDLEDAEEEMKRLDALVKQVNPGADARNVSREMILQGIGYGLKFILNLALIAGEIYMNGRAMDHQFNMTELVLRSRFRR